MINELDPEILDQVENNIDARRDFRIGGRGICVDIAYVHGVYVVTVPRADAEIHGSDLTLNRDTPSLTLWSKGLPVCVIGLLYYTKVTRL